MREQKLLRFLLILFFFSTTLLVIGELPTATSPVSYAQSSELSRIESDHSAVSRLGTWTSHNTASASGGSYLYSSGAVSDALLLNFVGTTIEISYVKNAALGSFAIEIDNVVRRTVVSTSDDTTFNNRAVINYLEAGQHTLKVYAVEGVIAIDAFFAILPTVENTRIEPAPPATTLVSPIGSTSSNPPTFVWNAVSTATWYYLYVNGPSGNIIKTWYAAADVGCGAGTGQCSITPAVTQIGGTHNWWVQTYGDGLGEWSSMGTYTQDNGMVEPELIVAIAPSGDTANNMPTYSWNADPWAEWYYLWVGNASGQLLAQWYSRTTAGCPAGTGTCSVTPTTRLPRDAITWYMQGWNSLGYGNWNGGTAFNVTVGPPQAAAILVAPNSPITTNIPTFTWNAVNEATSYRLYINGPGGLVLDQTFTEIEVGCAGGGTCSYTPSGALLSIGGTHTFWILSKNQWGDGLWSGGMSFLYTAIAPIQVTLTAPIGTIDNTLPSYQWAADPNATWYQLWVGTGSSTVISQWYSRTQAGCGGGTGTCSVHFTTPYLMPGSVYKWFVQSYNSTASIWSDQGDFSLSNAAGFIDWFSSDSGNWTGTPTPAIWTTVNGHHSTIASAANSWSTSYYTPQTYDNFDFYARLYRTGCLWCENGIIVRGTPNPLGFENAWGSGYGFFYDLEGNFIVKRFDSGVDPVILTPNGADWETTDALEWGEAYNVVRVVADGDELSFYINGVLVWTGTDGTYSSGNVGIAMKRGDPAIHPGNTGEIYADWAVLYRFVLP